MEKEEFLRLLPKLIRESDEVKGAIITVLSGIVATKDDITRVIEHSDKRFKAIDKRFEATKEDIKNVIIHSDKRFEAMDKRFEAIDKRFEATDKRFEAMDKRFEALINQINKGFEAAHRERSLITARLDSFTGRSGKSLENTILYLLNDELIQENIQASEIKKEKLIDKDGKVFAKNYTSDIDVLIQDGKTILIKIKYHPNNWDGYHLKKNAELFKLLFKKDYDDLMIICLEIKKVNLKQIEILGIRVIAGKVIE